MEVRIPSISWELVGAGIMFMFWFLILLVYKHFSSITQYATFLQDQTKVALHLHNLWLKMVQPSNTPIIRTNWLRSAPFTNKRWRSMSKAATNSQPMLWIYLENNLVLDLLLPRRLNVWYRLSTKNSARYR